MMFRIQPSGKEYRVTIEQAGPDVVIRIDGVGVITCQANEGSVVGPELVVYRAQSEEQGIAVRVEG